jgi:hypothetical protein
MSALGTPVLTGSAISTNVEVVLAPGTQSEVQLTQKTILAKAARLSVYYYAYTLVLRVFLV